MEPPATLLEDAFSAYDIREVHEVVVHAGPEVVWSALQEVPLRAVPVFRRLMTLRELPVLLVGRRWLTSDVDRPILAQMTASGFLLLAERPPAEAVLGLVTGRGDPMAWAAGPAMSKHSLPSTIQDGSRSCFLSGCRPSPTAPASCRRLVWSRPTRGRARCCGCTG